MKSSFSLKISVINTSFYGAIKEAEKHRDEISHIYGSLNGIEGLLNDNLIDMDKEDLEHLSELINNRIGCKTNRYTTFEE